MPQVIKNVKIPYATEGVIRSAQIDDVTTPENSVQLAVNFNFDRIGAWQSRPGVTTYANSLTGQINNFGTLNNTITPSGYSKIYKFLPTDTFDATLAQYITTSKVDSTHILVFWQGPSNYGYAQVMLVDATTGHLTPIGTALTFYNSGSQNQNKCIQIGTSNHYLNLWTTATPHGLAQVFTVNLSTFAVTAEGSPFTFDAAGGYNMTLSQIDTNHFITFYSNGSKGICEVLAVNLSTFAVTLPSSPLTFDNSSIAVNNSCSSLGDGIHFINFWTGASNYGQAKTFSVNTSTWAITAIGTTLTFDTFALYNSCSSLGDGQHFINFWDGSSATGGSTQIFNVNPSTFAVTSIGSIVNFGQAGGEQQNACVAIGDGEHFINFWQGVSNYGFAQVFDVNLTSFIVTPKNQPISYGIGSSSMFNSPVLINTYQVANFWQSSTNTGVTALFQTQSDIIYNKYLYAQQNDGSIYNLVSGSWNLCRVGLRTNEKARFAQYLNLIWMVNGNAAMGDPVQTSSGSTFSTTMVPTNFPPGDFIEAGFEGRIWVADASIDTLYFSDIVQFTPPSTYSLTFDISTNFISNFSSQNGETITALCQVPRALLVFKQNSIYRIYGAYSSDSYPAYNVGTYSQESIIRAKTGIYFHHSSGFYFFNYLAYAAQPIEISRRVIDFIKAIPRSYYGNITGIYDGFDSVKWAVGPITVDGVTYTNCMMRYTISTQVWTIYDYPGYTTTAMIPFDDGTNLCSIMGTSNGLIGNMDTGFTDFGNPIYVEMIDRWRGYTSMYSSAKSISGLMVSSENAAGLKIQYQIQKSPVDVWTDIDKIRDQYDALFPNANTVDFASSRLRFSGYTNGTPMIIHGIEILTIQDKGFEQN